MMVATAGYLSYSYRSNTVRVPYCWWHGFVLFCPHRKRENKCHCEATDLARNIEIPVVCDFAVLYRKVKTLIPIALLPSMTAELHPAVSSLEACQTPAR